MVYITKLKHTGSIISSSNQLGAKMYAVASRFFPQYSRGIFVGTGSGVIAQYFMQAAIPFVFVEKHPDFVKKFHHRFGAQAPLLGQDFLTLALDHSAEGLANCLVVSCMPVTGLFYSEPMAEQFRGVLNSGSTIVQMSYNTPFARQNRLFDELQQDHFKVQRAGSVFCNIPPASVFVLKKP